MTREECYACSAVIAPWSILTRAINISYRGKAIKYAEVIRDAWKA